MKTSIVMGQLAAILFLVSGGSAFGASKSVSFSAKCVVYVQGFHLLTDSFNLDTKDSNPADYKMVDFSVADSDGKRTSFTMKARLETLKCGSSTLNIYLRSKGTLVASTYFYDAEKGNSVTFYSKLLDDSFITCSGNVE